MSNNNVPIVQKMRGPGRPKKAASCTWCNESKLPLKYVFPTPNGKKEFCSENCLAEFRKAYAKGACLQCDNVLRGSATSSKDYCSTYCLNKYQKRMDVQNNRVQTVGPMQIVDGSQVLKYLHKNLCNIIFKLCWLLVIFLQIILSLPSMLHLILISYSK